MPDQMPRWCTSGLNSHGALFAKRACLPLRVNEQDEGNVQITNHDRVNHQRTTIARARRGAGRDGVEPPRGATGTSWPSGRPGLKLLPVPVFHFSPPLSTKC